MANNEQFYIEIIETIKQSSLTIKQLNKLKRDLCVKYKLKKIPTNIEILLNSSEQDFEVLKKKLLTKPVRSISGVAPVAIMTKPMPCPHAVSGVGPCSMCPGGPGSEFGDVPQSYTGAEPATMRGIRNNYDSYFQVFNRLEQFMILGHNCEKVELILMGGTFPSFPLGYQEDFVKYAFKAMNDFSVIFYNVDGEFDYLKFKEFFELPVVDLGDKERVKRIHEKLLKLKCGVDSEGCSNNNSNNCVLEEEQKKNETSKIKCVALCIETRPDYGLLKEGKQMLKLGCTRVELGIQSVYNDVLERIKRGHSTETSKRSIKTLKDLGFKVAIHYMPGLPGLDDKDSSSEEARKKDLEGMKQLFTDPGYCPDMIKIYPCMVTKGTKLYEEHKQGKFTPLTTDEARDLIIKFKKYVPEYCRIMRVQRDIPTKQIEAGVEMTNLRQYIHQSLVKSGDEKICRCIRCREVKNQTIDENAVKLKVDEYEASEGKEFFISIEDTRNDLLLGFLRLRIPSQYDLVDEISECSALVRELHVYGVSTPLIDEGEVQHRGFGKQLMAKAEEICKSLGMKKLVVISGVGVRGYYYKLGYKLDGVYVSKWFE